MPNHHDIEKLRAIKSFPSLVKYLRDDLDWPLESDDVDPITFEYSAKEIGLPDEYQNIIKDIRQLRPLAGNQPWGIFFVNFEKKKLPVVVMRRLLRALVFRKRASANKSDRQAWHPKDLLFISAYGEESDRAITLAHFVERPDYGDLAELRVLGWDDDDTQLKFDHIARTLHDKLRWRPEFVRDHTAWSNTWREAFVIRHGEVIRTSRELAITMAGLAKRIRGRVRSVLRYEDGFGEIRKLQRAFQSALIHDLSDDDFADMWAQTITYGLFSAAVSRPAGIHSGNLVDMVPITNPFLRDMLGTFLNISGRKSKLDFDELGIQEVVDLLNGEDTHLDAVLRDFGNRTRQEDPVIHFYELFLTEYDKQRKIQRGVFYTPNPVVRYIVRSVHELLQTEFGLEDGLASTVTWGEMIKRYPHLKLPPLTDEPGEKRTISPDEPFVVILDIATGTATFVIEVIAVIHETMVAKWKKAGKTDAQIIDLWNDYVPKHLLPRVYGFELMMAPYAIAHMKIGLKLTETGYKFRSHERARIYLTNTLEPKVRQLPAIGFEALAHEAKEVNEIKWYKRFTVVIGNPPYSVLSANLTETARRIVDPYRHVDGQKIEERSMLRLEMHLQDDYIKFLAFSQHALQQAGVGVLGLITNNGYLDNLTLRGVRFALWKQFRDLTILNLHGSRQRRNRAEETRDENVFDIEQGVAITTATESVAESSAPKTHYGEIVGLSEVKDEYLLGNTAASIQKKSITPQSPYYFFTLRDESKRPEYDNYFSITEAMPANISGIVTAHDNLVVDFDDTRLTGNARILRSDKIDDEKARELLEVKDNAGWKLAKVRREFRKTSGDAGFLKPYAYRPFDVRRIYYQADLVWCDRRKVMSHTIAGNNVALATCRQLASEPWEHLLVTRCLQDDCFISNRTRERSYHFPLYLYEDTLAGKTSRPNFSPGFLKAFASALKEKQTGNHGIPAGLTPEDIFHYAYAVFHSPAYRTRYAEFLKIDFPRLPLTSRLELFRALASLGGDLVALHLLESPKLGQPITQFIGDPKQKIEKVTYAGKTVWIDKAQTTGFKGVPDNVWNFHIGGYQVCEKWLKDRKTRTLSKDDIAHYHKIVIALNETIRLMSEIDKIIDKHGGWPIK